MMLLTILSSLIILTQIMYTFLQFYAKNLLVISAASSLVVFIYQNTVYIGDIIGKLNKYICPQVDPLS